MLDNKLDRINIWKCCFLRRGENRSTRRKNSRSRVESQQQTQPTYDAGSGNRTRMTLVGDERSHRCANPTLNRVVTCPVTPLYSRKILFSDLLLLNSPSHTKEPSRISSAAACLLSRTSRCYGRAAIKPHRTLTRKNVLFSEQIICTRELEFRTIKTLQRFQFWTLFSSEMFRN